MKPTHILSILSLTFVLAEATPCGAQQYNFTTLAGPLGPGAGYADGTGSDAQFAGPNGVAVDSVGNVYVADGENNTIRKITPGGLVSTLAGLAGKFGSDDGTGVNARFASPLGVAVDSADNVYVVDRGNNTIRKITPGGLVSTLAGLAGSPGSDDGAGSAARFDNPIDVAVDSVGNVYVAGGGKNTIRKITPGGVVSTLAGKSGSQGSADGTGSAARFNYPFGVAVDSVGNVYVADSSNQTIRKITPDGVVSTLAGLAGFGGSDDGTGANARFASPLGVAVDSADNVYVTSNNTIRKITPGGLVSTLAGLADSPGSDEGTGSEDGTGSAARFDHPTDVAVDSAGNLYVTDTYNSTIRKITPGGLVSTLAGLADRGSADGTGSAARFAYPRALAVDSAGNVYVADGRNGTIRKVTPTGVVTTLAGLAGSHGSADGTGSAARFARPSGVAVDSIGNVYVADVENNTIRKITPTGVVSTLAGLAGSFGSADGTGSGARFWLPSGVAVDSAGNVYVADHYNSTIRKITPGGVVSTLAGRAGFGGSDDGTGSAARFSTPGGFDGGLPGVAVDSGGNVYVTDGTTIRKITPGGVVSTLAGRAGEGGSEDGAGSAARFGFLWELGGAPAGVAVDSVGNVYVADTSNHTIRKITPSGVVSTLAGQPHYLADEPYNFGSADGTGSAARFSWPLGVAVDSAGNVYVADTAAHKIRLGKAVLVTQPKLSANSLFRLADGQFQFEVTASTNQLVLIQAASVLPATNWNTIQTITLWNGRSTISDPGAPDFPLRFYRAISHVP